MPRRGSNSNHSLPHAAGGDRLGALPDEILQHVLSFLPAHDAVRTCVLARRWHEPHDLWKSARSLHIWRKDLEHDESVEEAQESVRAVRKFVDHLLLLRGGSPLDKCELHFTHLDYDDIIHVNLWIRHILMCKVRVLSLSIPCHIVSEPGEHILDFKLKSNHLKKLQLSNINISDNWVDFSCCPVLEALEVDHCDLTFIDGISSQFLKCLSISECYFHGDSRIHINVPNLLSLRLEVGQDMSLELYRFCDDRTPVLERMPSLVDAFVQLYPNCLDQCRYSADSGYGGCELDKCIVCSEIEGDRDHCVLLQGLSEARNLALMSYVTIFIFRRDLKFRPIFSNLKSLLLDEYWCVPDDFSALAYMLEHSPVLEKLTLQLCSKGPKSEVKVKGMPDPADRSPAISEHVKIVEVQCEVINDEVQDVLEFLSNFGICFCVEGLDVDGLD